MPAALPRPVQMADSSPAASFGQTHFDAQELRDSYGIPLHQSFAYMQQLHDNETQAVAPSAQYCDMRASQDPYHYDHEHQQTQDAYFMNSSSCETSESSDNGCSYTRLLNPSSPMTEEQ
jgi:hypothetical protein